MLKLSYKYYVVNSDMKIVCGFPTEEQAVDLAKKHRYKVYSGNNLKNKGIDTNNMENWSFALFDVKEENK